MYTQVRMTVRVQSMHVSTWQRNRSKSQNSPFLQTLLPPQCRLMMGRTGPAGGAGRVLVGAAGAPKNGRDALGVARVRCVRRWTSPKSVPCLFRDGQREPCMSESALHTACISDHEDLLAATESVTSNIVILTLSMCNEAVICIYHILQSQLYQV